MCNIEISLEYILNSEKERNDYIEHCKQYDKSPFFISKNRSPSHIYEVAAYALVQDCGYDLEGWVIEPEFLK